MRFYTADEHYNHANIIRFCKRPFADVREMKEFFINAHNSKVGKGDITFHVGDMFWQDTPEHEAIEILNRLNGKHAFVWGNHDEVIEKSPAIRTKFVKIDYAIYLEKTVLCPKIYLHHYACRVWRNSHNGSYHLYGHSHAALPEAHTLSFDCGVDSRPDYAPWSESEVVAKMTAKIAAGAQDEMEAKIKAEPWNKADGSSAAYPEPIVKCFTREPIVETTTLMAIPEIPKEVWDSLKEAVKAVERTTGADKLFGPGRCIR